MWTTALASASETAGFAKNTSEGVKYLLRYDENNTPFVEVDEDILNGVPSSEWITTVKINLAQKFPNGVRVGKNEVKINGQSRKEMTYSEYTKWLKQSDPSVYADKLRATNNADEIILASREYINEGLHHARKDNIHDFARGSVLLKIGGNDYSADVIIGSTTSGAMLLYDVLNLQSITINERSRYAQQAANNGGHRIGTSANDKLSPKSGTVNPNIRESGENDAPAGKFSLRDAATVYGPSYININRNGWRDDFDAAKGGNTEAATRLVERIADESFVAGVKQRFEGCELIPVTRAADGSNVIPSVLAKTLSGRAGMELRDGVVITNGTQKKDYGKFDRLFAKAEFEASGDFKGVRAVIVDDVVSSGGTAAELASFLESQGAKVEGVISLFKGKNATDKLGILPNQKADIERLVGRETVENAIGRKLDDLTFREAETILNNRGSFREPLKFSIKDGMTDGAYVTAREAYKGRDLANDGEVYAYDFLTALPDISIVTEGDIQSAYDKNGIFVKNKAISIGMENAKTIGAAYTDAAGNDAILVENLYTGRQLRITASGINHSMYNTDGKLNPYNTRASMIAGDLARNAVPINALHDRATDVIGTYAMVAPMLSRDGKKSSVVMLTVEIRSGDIIGLDVYDQAHAISTRKRSEVGLNAAASQRETATLPPIASNKYSMADFLKIVNTTHQSLLSNDVLSRLGEVRKAGGAFTDKVKYQLRSGTAEENMAGFNEFSEAYKKSPVKALTALPGFASEKAPQKPSVLYPQVCSLFSLARPLSQTPF